MCQQRMFKFCYLLLGNRHEAEDAVQETFLKAYRYLAAYRQDDSFLAWLYKIAANECRTIARKNKKWRFPLPLWHGSRQEKSAEQTFVEQPRNELEWLAPLSPTEKELLVLRIFEDQTFDDIARIMGLTPAVARKRFERLKRKLQRSNPERNGDVHVQAYEL